MIEKEKFDELQKKQDDLRLERNKLADEQQKIQKQIDEIEIQKYDVERFVGKIIITKKMIGAVYVSTNYMIVDRVERLYKGPRFYGKSIEICFSNSTAIGNSICMYERSEYSGIAWSGVDTIDDLKYINSDIFRKIAESQDVKALQIIMDTNYRVHEKDISDALEYINNIQETDSADYSELIQNLNILAGNMTT